MCILKLLSDREPLNSAVVMFKQKQLFPVLSVPSEQTDRQVERCDGRECLSSACNTTDQNR